MVRLVFFLFAIQIAAGLVWAQDSLRIERAYKCVTLSGYTRARAQQVLASEVAGRVLAVHYDVGMPVGREPFLEIDPTFIDFQIAQARLNLEKLKVARARSASVMDHLEKEYQRIDTLRRDNVTTLSRWEAAGEELTQARLAVQAADLEIKTVETQIRELEERRKRHCVVAPAGWVIVQRRVEPGEIIAAGTPLAQAADFTQLVVPLFVSARELAAIRAMEKLTVLVEGRPVSAVIKWINPEFNERTRKLAIELALVDYSGGARGGLLTELAPRVAADALMVPKAAVSNRFDNPYIVLKESGKSVSIMILDESDDHILIADKDPLTPGMELVVR